MMKSAFMIALLLMTYGFLWEIISASPSSRNNVEQMNIKESLEFIINHPINKERPAGSLLGPPLTEEEIALALEPVLDNRDASDLEQLLQLYQVTNGLKTFEAEAAGLSLKDVWLIPGYHLLSLHEVVETLTTIKKTSSSWNPNWLPLFSSRAGDFLVYDTENGHILVILTKESLRWEVAPSIEEFLQDKVQKLSDGRIFINENGLMDEITTDTEKNADRENEILDEEVDVTAPTLSFNCANMPNVCQNIRNAINNNGKPSSLQRITDTKQIRANRRAACGKATCVAPNKSCDEYPFASSAQGGAGATIKCVPLSENNSQGGQLAAFYRNNNVNNLDWFNVNTP